ncbi:DUF2946 domain-containing protein [Pseudothauera nasutitermitis]|nr:DUF2946 domain-containing protein [Pseudothauera nasutitermitis]
MFRNALQLRTGALIAIFAVLLGALAPTVSRALLADARGDSAWMEVCTPDGMMQVAVGAGGTDGPGDAAGSMDACAYCCPHAGSFALLPQVAQGWQLSAVTADVHARSPSVVPRAQSAWAPLQPRAPPSLS